MIAKLTNWYTFIHNISQNTQVYKSVHNWILISSRFGAIGFRRFSIPRPSTSTIPFCASVGFDEYRNRKILSGKNPRQCNSCGKFFGSHSSLHRHKQMYHSNKELPQCNICGKRFSSLSNLGVHKISHTNARPFKCNQCSKTYKYKHDLKNHRCKV